MGIAVTATEFIRKTKLGRIISACIAIPVILATPTCLAIIGLVFITLFAVFMATVVAMFVLYHFAKMIGRAALYSLNGLGW